MPSEEELAKEFARNSAATARSSAATARSSAATARSSAATARNTAQMVGEQKISNQQLVKLNQTTNEMLGVQRDIAQKQAQLVELNKQQVQLQAETLDVARKQLAVQQQQLVFQQISTIQLELQTQLQKESELRRRRQAQLKEGAYSVRQGVEEIKKKEDAFLRYIYLMFQNEEVKYVGLQPNELEEINDKEYVREVINNLNTAMSDAEKQLSQEHYSFLESLKLRRQLEDTIANLRQMIEEWNNEIDEIKASMKVSISSVLKSLIGFFVSLSNPLKIALIVVLFFISFLMGTWIAGAMFGLAVFGGLIYWKIRQSIGNVGEKERTIAQLEKNIAQSKNELEKAIKELEGHQSNIQSVIGKYPELEETSLLA